MSKKTNPRKRPVNQADLLKAKKEAEAEAVKAAFAIMFTVLRDNHNASIEELQQFWNEVDKLSESVAEGYVTITDLLHTLQEEANIILY